jgi:acyl-CoA reductase-like NAD-dependent aldehyde dehydrogenase
MNPNDRGRLLHRLADLIEKHVDELARLESLDNGKPVKMAATVDLPMTINCIRYYAGAFV